MDISPNVLRKDTVDLIRHIDAEIENLMSLPKPHRPIGALASLFAAKATAYNTLVLLSARK